MILRCHLPRESILAEQVTTLLDPGKRRDGQPTPQFLDLREFTWEHLGFLRPADLVLLEKTVLLLLGRRLNVADCGEQMGSRYNMLQVSAKLKPLHQEIERGATKMEKHSAWRAQ